MIRLFYSAIFYLILPLLLVRMWLRGAKAPAYRSRWHERLGFTKPPADIKHGLLFHCVSVGETIAAIPLIKSIMAQYPELPVTITTTTPTGSERVKAAFGDSVFHCYLPFDLPFAMQRFFKRLSPKVFVIMETELWPNLLYTAKKHGVKTLLANARLSPKSARGYAKIGSVSRMMMQCLNGIAAHNATDGQRFIELGLPPEKLAVTGSIKFDISIPASLADKKRELQQQWATDRPIVIAASTHENEEKKVIAGWKRLNKQLEAEGHLPSLLMLVPRHPERFNEVAELLTTESLHFIRRSQNVPLTADIDVILGDTMGELLLLYSVSTVAFVGGSLVDIGGHNPLEPAALGVPVVSGPHITNFKQIYRLMEEHNAVHMAMDEEDFAHQMEAIITDPLMCKQMGDNGIAVVQQNRGAMQALSQRIDALITETSTSS